MWNGQRADRLKFNGAMQAVWDGKDAFQIENILASLITIIDYIPPY